MIGAELHLEVKTVLWQEKKMWQEGSDSVAGNGDVPPAPESRAHRAAFPAGFRVSRSQGSLPDRTWVAQRTKLCPLSSSQDSTIPPSCF